MISIIIPVYNKEKYINRTIESLKKQTYNNYEIIIINDGSTDNSESIIKIISANNPKIRFFTQKNSGVASTRNVGIEMANGDYISFLDADDEWDEKFLEKMIVAISDGDASYCAHNIQLGPIIKKAKFCFNNERLLERYISNKCTPNTNSWLISKKYLNDNKIRFRNGIDWGEDMMFFAEIIARSKNIYPCKEYLSTYHTNLQNSLSSNSISKIDKDIQWINKLKEVISSTHVDIIEKKRCISLLDHYRLPGAVIYRLLSNYNNVPERDFLNACEKYKAYIKFPKIMNGQRSIKLTIMVIKLLLIKSSVNLTKIFK